MAKPQANQETLPSPFVHTYTVDTTADPDLASTSCTDDPDVLPCSLRAAVEQANTDQTLDEVVLPAGTYLLSQDQLVDTDAAGLKIHGESAGSTTIQADSASATYPFRVLQLNSGATLAVRQLTLTGGDSETNASATSEDGFGGGIEVLNGTLNLRASAVTGNTAGGNGGGIYVAAVSGGGAGQAFLHKVTLSDNHAASVGGGMDDEGQVQATRLTVTGNDAADFGGGISLSSDTLTGAGPSMAASKLTVTGNSATAPTGEGGGIYNNGTLVLAKSTIGSNTAAYGGGGVYNYYLADVREVSVEGNTAGDYGGGIYNDYQLAMLGGTITDNGPTPSTGLYGAGLYSDLDATLTNVAISNNSAYSGGGVYDDGYSFQMSGGSITGNTADPAGGWGGGLYLAESGHLNDVVVAGNSAAWGGGIYAYQTISLTNMTIGTSAQPNVATMGGGIYSGGFASVTIRRSTIAYNQAVNSSSGYGAGLFVNGSTELVNSTVSGNSADYDGGGAYVDTYGNLLVVQSTIDSNTASQYAGGIDNYGLLTMTNATLTLNQAGSAATAGDAGGIYNDPNASASLTNATVSDNLAIDSTSDQGVAGGIANTDGGALQLRGTIVADNTATEGGDCAGTVNSAGGNLDSDGTCGLAGIYDQSSVDPQLGPLADNGGLTETEAIPDTSPAASGDPFCRPPNRDQRGVHRAPLCDIGAYEDTAA